MNNGPYPEYEERIIVFLDILGWKNLIEQTQGNSQIVDSLVDKTDAGPHTQNLIKRAKENHEAIPFGFEVAHFSDTIVLSCRANEPGAIDLIFVDAKQRSNNLLKPTLYLTDSLHRSGLLCRGAVAKGKLFHRDNVFFGPVLHKAIEMEKAAVYPRILVANELVADLGTEYKPETSVRKDFDDRYYLDTLSAELYPPNSISGNLHHSRTCFLEFRESISDGLNRFGLDPKYGKKWVWIANYFNQVISGRHDIGVEPIRLPVSSAT